MSKPSAALVAAATANQKIVPQDKLERLKAEAAKTRELEFEVAELQERLNEKLEELNILMTKTLPDLMEEAGVDSVGIPAQGNYPAWDARLRPFYNANIASSWPEEKRLEGFNYLTKIGHGDLIKTEIKISLPRGALKKAQTLVKQLAKQGMNAVMEQNVHSQTLKAWLKDQIENHAFMPDLEKIGASVGKTVKPEKRRGN